MAGPRRVKDEPAAPLSAEGAHDHTFLIVEGRYYTAINDAMLAGAAKVFAAAGVRTTHVVVPGALEIPIALAIALETAEAEGRAYAGAIAIGCVVRGETYHFEIVANESNRALTALAVAHALPFGNAILTVDNEAQALERADPAQGDKGGDAARAALALAALKQGVTP